MGTTNLKPKTQLVTIVEKAVYLIIPLFATVVLILMPYIALGATISVNVQFCASAILTVAAMAAYFFPARTLFKDMFLNKPRIRSKLFEYSIRSTLVYNGHLREFDEFCDYEFETRKQKFINRNLQLVDFRFDEFVSKYKFDITAIKADQSLSKRQRHSLIKIVRVLRFIKRQDYNKVLPGTEFGTEFRRVKTNVEAMQRLGTGKKVVSCMLMAVSTIALIPTLNMTATPLEIAMQVLIRLGCGLWQVFSALMAANKLINKIYFSELSEKNLFMDEFIEHKHLAADLTAIAQSASKTLDGEQFQPVFVTKIIQEQLTDVKPASVEEVVNADQN